MSSYGDRTEQPTTYHGNCHCGLIMFTVTLPNPLNQSLITSCNCSICTRNGYLIVATKTENITWYAGEALLRTYRFGNRNRVHKFCHQCGTSVLMDGSEDKRAIFQDKTFLNVSGNLLPPNPLLELTKLSRFVLLWA